MIPSLKIGQPKSSFTLLKNSLHSCRLYHSVAWLTQNAEVLVSGSEVTSDYTAQVGVQDCSSSQCEHQIKSICKNCLRNI